MSGVAPHFSRATLVDALHGLIEFAGEYYAHGTALFLMGLQDQPPQALTIVSPRRRRGRTLGRHEIVFVTLPKSRLEPTQMLDIDGREIPVSTPEKTLVDLLALLDHAPPAERLAELFIDVPYDADTVISLARQTSDSVLKRASWWLAYAGRLRHVQIPFAEFTATPVRLDPRSDGPKSAWDGRFRLKVPTGLLTTPRPTARTHLPVAVADWLELVSTPALHALAAEQAQIVIRDDPTPRARRLLDAFAGTFIADADSNTIDALLAGHARIVHGRGGPHAAPRWLNHWLEGHLQKQGSAAPALGACPPSVAGGRRGELPRQREIIAWVGRHLTTTDLERLESALLLGYRLGLGRPVLTALERHGYALFDAGLEATVLTIAQAEAARGHALAVRTCVTATRALTRAGANADALAMIDRERRRLDIERPLADQAEMAYTAGNILRRLGRFADAEAELAAARQHFAAAGSQRGFMMVEAALGCMAMTRGNALAARHHLRTAAAALPARGARQARLTIWTSLGQTEYGLGRLRRAIELYGRALRLSPPRRTATGADLLRVERAKALLALGEIPRAHTDLLAVLRPRREPWATPAGISAAALMAWTCQLLGQDGAARTWWTSIDTGVARIGEPRLAYIVGFIRGNSRRFAGDLAGALTEYRHQLPTVTALRIAEADCCGLWWHIAGCESVLGKPEAELSLRRARAGFLARPGLPEADLAEIFTAARFAGTPLAAGIDLDRHLAAALANGIYDPFWAWYAADLLALGHAAGERFVANHLRRTPHAAVQQLVARTPRLRKIVDRFSNTIDNTLAGLTWWSPQGTRRFDIPSYDRWRTGLANATLSIDGPGGVIACDGRRSLFTSGSLVHGMLANLVAAWPHAIATTALFPAVWGSPFDPEIDPPALKTALYRVRRALRSVKPGANVQLEATVDKFGALRLVVPGAWEAVF